MSRKLYYVVESNLSSNKIKLVSQIFKNEKDALKFLKDANKNKLRYGELFGIRMLINTFWIGWHWDDPHGRLEIEFLKSEQEISTETRKFRHKELDKNLVGS